MSDFGNWLGVIFVCWTVGAAIIGLLCEAKDLLPELTEEEKQSEADWWNANR